MGEQFRSTCGTPLELSKRIGVCLQPIFDVVEGKVSAPRGDEDMVAICNRFQDTEKCIRTIAKNCLVGLHKTAVGSVS